MSGSQSRNSKASSPKAQEDAVKIAKSTQKPGQTKEQTRLVAQGIQKGIEQYKRQHKAKLRELDKQQKKKTRQPEVVDHADTTGTSKVVHKTNWLPWVLLIASWSGFAAYIAA